MNSEAFCAKCVGRVMTGEENCQYINEHYQHVICPRDRKACKDCGELNCCCPEVKEGKSHEKNWI